MPKPVVRASNPPAELADRSEGWGRFGRIQDYPEYKDDGEWAEYPTLLFPSSVMHNEEYPLEHPETSDRVWARTDREITDDEVIYDVVYLVRDEDPETPNEQEQVVVAPYSIDEINTGITES